MIDVPYAHPEIAEIQAGLHWKRLKDKTGRISAVVYCWFGHAMDLTGYVVDRNGMLVPKRDDWNDDPPEIHCATKGCTFSGRLRLRGWIPPR